MGGVRVAMNSLSTVSHKKLFLNTKNLFVFVIGYIVAVYISFFITYFAIKEDYLLFKIKYVILILILSYFIIIILKKILLPKNIILISICPINIKSIILNIFLCEYLKFILLASSIILPDVILKHINLIQFSALMMYSLIAIIIEFRIVTYNQKNKLLSNLYINLGLIFVINFFIMYLTFDYHKLFSCLVLILTPIALIIKYLDSRLVYENVYKNSYLLHRHEFCKLINIFENLLSRMKLSNRNYLFFWELKRLISNERFGINLIRSFFLSFTFAFFIIKGQYNETVFFDLTILLSASNYFSSTTYYSEKLMYIFGDVMPLNQLHLFNVKLVINTIFWIIITLPYIFISLYKSKNILLLDLFFVISSFLLWAFIGGVIEKSINFDRRTENKSIYSRLYVIFGGIIYLYLLKDITNNTIFSLQAKALLYIIINLLSYFILRRFFSAKISKCYKEV